MSEDISTMPDEQIALTVADGTAELERRATIRDAERRTDEMCLDYLHAAGRTNGGIFETPTGFIGAYPRGWRVSTADGVFEANAPGVTTSPPGEGWDPVDPDSPLIAFWEPRRYSSGSHVRDAGRVWTATSSVDGQRPSEYPGGWTVSS